MAEVQDINRVVQIVPETVAGTAVTTATKRIASLLLNATPMIETGHYKGSGYRFNTVNPLNKEWTEIGLDDSPPTYDELPYLLAGICGQPTITTPGGGTNTRQHAFALSTTANLTPVTYTMEIGSPVRAARIAGVQFTGFGMKFSRDEVTVNGSGIGAQYTDGIQLTKNATYTLTAAASPPTAGNYTLTVNGVTTASIVYNATPAAVQTALEALAGVGVGQVVVTLLANGPTTSVASTTYTIEFRGTLAGQAVTVTGTFTGLTPSNSITVPAGIVGSTPTSLALIPIIPPQVSVYADATAAGLGTTKLLRVFEASFELSDIYGPMWVLDAAKPSYAATVEIEPSATFHLVAEADAVGMAYLTNVRAGTRVFIRIESVGAIIEGALTYRARFDFALDVSDIKFGEQDGVDTVEIDFEVTHDSTWGKAIAMELRNTLLAVA